MLTRLLYWTPSFLCALGCLLIGGAALAQTAVGGTLSTDTLWDLAGSPYQVGSNVFVQGTDGADGVTTLTIEPGVVVEFADNTYLTVGLAQPGALVADGDAVGGPSTIIFTSATPGASGAMWTGLRFGSQNQNSILRNAVVEHAGRGLGFSGAVRADGGSLNLEDVTVRDSGITNSAGLYVNGSAAAVTVDGCNFADNLTYDLRLTRGSGSVYDSSFSSVYFDNANASFSFSGNAVTDFGSVTSRLSADAAARWMLDNVVSTTPGLTTEIYGGIQQVDGSWTSAFGEIHLLNTLNVRGTDGPDGVTTLTIEGGLRIAVDNFDEVIVGDFGPGALIVDGDLGPSPGPVLFTSLDPAPVGAEWGGIWMWDQARDSILRNVEIEYAGRGGGQGAVHLNGVTGVSHLVDRLTVRENGNTSTSGLYLFRGNLTMTGSQFQDNAYFDLFLRGGSGMVSASTLSSVHFDDDHPFDFTGNTFVNWGARESSVFADVAVQLTSVNSMSAVPGARTRVLGGLATRDGSFSPTAGEYEVVTTVVVAGTDGPDGVTTLTIEPGTRLLMGPSFLNRFEIGRTSGDPGALVIPAGGAPVVFREELAGVSGAGAWEGIDIRATGRASIDGLEVVAARIGLESFGTLDLLRNVTFRRSVTGLSLQGSSPLLPDRSVALPGRLHLRDRQQLLSDHPPVRAGRVERGSHQPAWNPRDRRSRQLVGSSLGSLGRRQRERLLGIGGRAVRSMAVRAGRRPRWGACGRWRWNFRPVRRRHYRRLRRQLPCRGQRVPTGSGR